MVDTTKMVRFGILGCAEIPRKVPRAIDLAPNATLCALASHSKEKAEKFAAENGFPASVKIYGSYRLLQDPGVDVVYVPLLTSLHVRWVVMVAGRKKHVLVEKPATLDVAELDQILAAVKSNDVQFWMGSCGCITLELPTFNSCALFQALLKALDQFILYPQYNNNASNT